VKPLNEFIKKVDAKRFIKKPVSRHLYNRFNSKADAIDFIQGSDSEKFLIVEIEI
jgi:hypothetical protein